MKNHRHLPKTLLAALVLAGCSSMPAADSPLAQARSEYNAAQDDSRVTTLAAGELRQARESLDRANHASKKGEKDAVVDHLAYVTRQQVAIARETASQKGAELAVANASAARDTARLAARTREADDARRDAEASQRSAEASQRRSRASLIESRQSQFDAQAAQRQSEAAQRSADASLRIAATERQAANEAQMDAQAARQQTLDAQARAAELEAMLNEMEAKKTDRGMVVTLGDVLFDTNQSQLKSGGMRSIQRLADFFKQYPQRTVMIEGFTDSTGGSGANQELSDNRAHAVRTALLDMGIGAERISSRGYGESYPVAGNDTAAGRQLNRRVEMIVSEDGGVVAPR